MKNSSYFLKILAISIIPSLFLIVFRSDTLSLVRFFPDDAFYYLQTAWNFSRTGSVSFDGTNSITGFHPLWLLVSSGLIFFSNKEMALVGVFLFNSITVALSLYLLAKTFFLFNKKVLNLALIAILTLPIFNFFLFTSSGMESGLLVICFSWFFYVFCRALQSDSIRHQDSFFIGLAAGFVALARLDSVVVLLFFGLYYLYTVLKDKRISLAVTALITFLFVISPYFIWLWEVQENFLPMSSIAKYGRERWSIEAVLRSLAGTNIVGHLFFAVPLLLNILTLLIRSSSAENRRLVFTVKISAFAGVAYLLYVLLVAHEPYRWYLNITQIISLFSLVWLISRAKYVSFLRVRVVVPAVLLINFGFLVAWSMIETTSYGLLKMTLEVNDLVPRDSVIATNDSGVVGYFATGKVHNLDGIANSLYNWDKYLSKLDYADYFKRYSVNYFIIRAEFVSKEGIKDLFNPDKNRISGCRKFAVERFGEQIMCQVLN